MLTEQEREELGKMRHDINFLLQKVKSQEQQIFDMSQQLADMVSVLQRDGVVVPPVSFLYH
jgi:septal ring factor EnvC (AmiA/AmiB activator)